MHFVDFLKKVLRNPKSRQIFVSNKTNDMTTVKKIKTTKTITITETNYASGSNKGAILGKTLRPAYTQWRNGKRVAFIWKDVDSNDKFITDAVDGKVAIQGMEFAECVAWRGFNNDEPRTFTKVNWTKTNPICLKFKMNE